MRRRKEWKYGKSGARILSGTAFEHKSATIWEILKESEKKSDGLDPGAV
jgi:hypothetical protein